MENRDEFYVTVFSNTSVELYDNTLSRFQVQLPKTITLDSDFKWNVALTEIIHSTILGTGNYQDEVLIANTSDVVFDRVDVELAGKTNYLPIGNTKQVISLIWNNSKQPFLYKPSYFSEFLELSNLENFDTNKKLLQYKVDVLDVNYINTVLIPPFEYTPTYRANKKPVGSKGKDAVDSDYIILQIGRSYTCKQILWLILAKFSSLFTRYKENEKVFENYVIAPSSLPDSNSSVAEQLLILVKAIVNAFENRFKQLKSKTLEVESNFFVVYCDFVAHRIVGDQITNALYITSRRYNNQNVDNIVVKNLQYVAVNKLEISSMAFKLCNERGELLYLESG